MYKNKKIELEERDKLIIEWMRNDDAFKNLARKFGKGSKHANLESHENADLELEQKQKELLEWLGKDDAFKNLTKKFGDSFSKPNTKSNH